MKTLFKQQNLQNYGQKLAENEKRNREKEINDEIRESQKKLNYKQTLQEQMREKESKKRVEMRKVGVEKKQVDDQVQRLIDEDLMKIDEIKLRKGNAFNVMQVSLAEKEKKRQTDFVREKKEDNKYKEYLASFDKRINEQVEKKSQMEINKNIIYEQIRIKNEKKMEDLRELEILKQELMLEEQKEKERTVKREQELKLKRNREEMLKWEEAETIIKEKNKSEEIELEVQFKLMLQQEFFKKEKLEQMNQQKRRLREQQYRKEIDALWLEKLERLKAVKDREMEDVNVRKRELQWEEKVIREEQRRVLEVHLPRIQDACTPSLWSLAKTLV